jgi:hypothetical protein
MNYVMHKEQIVLVDDRTMKQLAMQEGQQVDYETVTRIIIHNYAWCVTDLELAKAGGPKIDQPK